MHDSAGPFTKLLIDPLIPVPEDFPELILYKHRMRRLAKPPKGQPVVYEIGHFHAAFYFPEVMLVMPEPVGPSALFINE